jgi:tetratricopeptide (TPR) repeat protein
VRGMIAKKLDALEEGDRRTLECASLLGEEFTTTVVATLLAEDELVVEDALERIRRAHRLIDGGGEVEFPDGSRGTRYRFVHALYQNALYSELAPSRKAALHRKAAARLAALHAGEDSRIAGTLALHFERGRDYPAAADQCITAGNNAVTMYATAQAIDYYTHALELIAKLAVSERFEREVVARHKRSEAYLSARMLDDAMRDCEAVLALARGAFREDWECRSLNALGLINNYARQPELMSAYATEALAIASRVGDRALKAEAKAVLANSRMVVGEVSEARALFGEAIQEARLLRHAPALLQALTYGGVARFFQTEYSEAERLETEAAAVAAESRDGFYLALSLFYLGLSRANNGNVGAAFQALSEAFELAKRNGNQIALSRVPNGIGWLWREMGDVTRAMTFNHLCVETARKTKAAEAEANALINLIYDFLAVGQPSKALDSMEKVEPLFERERWNHWRFFGIRYHAARAEYCLSQGKLDDTQQHGATLLRNAQHYGIPKYIAVAHRLLGEAAEMEGRLADAEEHFSTSLSTLRANPAPIIEWRILSAFGQLLARAGRPAAAGEQFFAAARVIDNIASTIMDPAVASEFKLQPSARQAIAEAAGSESGSKQQADCPGRATLRRSPK